MLLRTTKIISFSILLSFTNLFSSCTLMTTMLEPFIAQLKSKVNYEEKELFCTRNLGYAHNPFYCVKSIAYDDDYIYCVTKDDDYYHSGHGILVKCDFNGNIIKSMVICDEVRKAGYDDCYAYNLKTVDVYDDKIIICGESSVMFPIYTELICLDKNTLEVLWHWHSKQYECSEHSSTARWNSRYIFQYRDSTSGKTAWLTILDENGKELVTKRIGSCGWSDAGEPVISGDTLIVRTVSHSYEAYDLNLLLDPSLTSEEALVSCPDEVDSYYNFSGIIADDNSFYTHSAKQSDTFGIMDGFIECYDKNTFTKNWKTQLDELYHLTYTLPTPHKGKLFVPVEYGAIYCLDTNTGKKLWYSDIRQKQDYSHTVNLYSNSCIVSDRWLCITNSSKELLVIDIKDGEVMARLELNLGSSNIQSFSKDGYLYLTGYDSLYRFRFWEK